MGRRRGSGVARGRGFQVIQPGLMQGARCHDTDDDEAGGGSPFRFLLFSIGRSRAAFSPRCRSVVRRLLVLSTDGNFTAGADRVLDRFELALGRDETIPELANVCIELANEALLIGELDLEIEDLIGRVTHSLTVAEIR